MFPPFNTSLEALSDRVAHAPQTVAGCVNFWNKTPYQLEYVIPIQNLSNQAETLSNIASAYIDMGDRESAKATLDRAVAAVQSAPQAEPDWRWFSALTAISAAQTKAGQNEAAQQTLTVAFEGAQAVADMEKRLERLFEIAAAQTEVGDAESARQTVDTALTNLKSIKDARLWPYIPSNTPLAADQLSALVEIVKSFEFKHRMEKDRAFSRLGDRLGERRASSHVMEILKLIESPVWRNSVLSALAAGQRDAAQFAEAIKTTGLIEDPDDRFLPLKYIAEAQAKAGQIADARATIGLMTEAVKARGEDSLHLIWLAETQVEAGLVREAKDSLRKSLQSLKRDIERCRGDLGDCMFNIIFETLLELLLEMHDASLL